MFGDKECIGVRVFEDLRKYEDMSVPSAADTEAKVEYLMFSYASRMLAAANVPNVYSDVDTVGIAFGENARYVSREDIKKGIILDARAAEILAERGIDVGFERKGESVGVNFENFVFNNERVLIQSSSAYIFELKEGAKVESTFTTVGNLTEMASSWSNDASGVKNEIVASYTYENSQGERFLVFTFDGGLAHNTLLRSYARADQIKRALPYLGKSAGFYICTAPDLYSIAKRKEAKVSVGLWNFCADAVDDPVIYIDGGIKAHVISTIGCEAVVEDGAIKLSRIEPYGFAAVEYEEK